MLWAHQSSIKGVMVKNVSFYRRAPHQSDMNANCQHKYRVSIVRLYMSGKTIPFTTHYKHIFSVNKRWIKKTFGVKIRYFHTNKVLISEGCIENVHCYFRGNISFRNQYMVFHHVRLHHPWSGVPIHKNGSPLKQLFHKYIQLGPCTANVCGSITVWQNGQDSRMMMS